MPVCFGAAAFALCVYVVHFICRLIRSLRLHRRTPAHRRSSQEPPFTLRIHIEHVQSALNYLRGSRPCLPFPAGFRAVAGFAASNTTESDSGTTHKLLLQQGRN